MSSPIAVGLATLLCGCPVITAELAASKTEISGADTAAEDPLEIDNDGDGFSETQGDCDDLDPTSYPKTWYADTDGDGFGDATSDSWECEPETGFSENADDCDDTDPLVHPGAAEQESNTECMADTDEDGWGEASPLAGIAHGTDCNDSDATVYPEASEICDGQDNDCDNAIPADEQDDDSDGFVECTISLGGWDGDPSILGDDCDDSDDTTYPAAPERCDGQDNSCNGQLSPQEVDNDSDGFVTCIIEPGGWDGPLPKLGGDCDDNTQAVNPDQVETCDSIDNDCDGEVDEEGALNPSTWYRDLDSDGFGDEAHTVEGCSPPSGYVVNNIDCNDIDNTVYPTATEICDGQDNNCDTTLPTEEQDVDSDGYVECTLDSGGWDGATSLLGDDCDDASNAVHPTATEICDGIDNDCDNATDEDDASDASTWYADSDGDGYGDPSTSAPSCAQPASTVSDDTDCDDTDPTVFPLATELCDGQVNACGSTLAADETDSDADGYVACTIDSGGWDGTGSMLGGDCNEGAATAHPTATEVCDSIDNDCDGTADESDAADASTWYIDSDNDGYGHTSTSQTACDQPSGYAATDTDCDDSNPNAHPGLSETWYDGVDADCDGAGDYDADGDGDDSDSHSGSDCDDTDATVDGLDTDADGYSSCDGDCNDADSALSLQDADNDGFSTCDGDCNDFAAITFPGAAQHESTTACMTDQDDDGWGDDTPASGVTAGSDCDDSDATLGPLDQDGDGYSTCDGDCNDATSAISPGVSETWYDGIDSDCDGANDYDADADGYDASAHGGTDCDDNDSTSTLTTTDGDCDGTLTADDCDDTDPASTTIATDADCDTVLTADDCDDGDSGLGDIALDADCDGTLTADDCDDSDPNVGVCSNCNGWDWNHDGTDNVCAVPVLFAPLNGAGDDMGPSVHSVTNNGASAATDRCGTTGAAMGFDGSSYLSIPDSTDFAFGSGDYTISLWSNSTDSSAMLIAQWAQGLQTGGGSDDAFFLAYDTFNNGTVLYDITNNGTGDQHLRSSSSVPSTWHHFAVVTESGTTSIYLNGTSIGSMSMGTVWDSNYDLTIGSGLSGIDAMTGSLDDVAIFTEALSATDIAALYGSDCWDDADGDGYASDVDCDDYDITSTTVATDGDCDGVLTADDCDDLDAAVGPCTTSCPSNRFGYWNFNQITGTTAVDSEGANDGTINGALSYANGAYGAALDFGSTSNAYNVTLPQAVGDATMGAQTIAFWIRPNSLPGGVGMSVYATSGGTGQAGQYIRVVSGHVDWHVTNGSTYCMDELTTRSIGSLTVNNWHHVALTWDGQNGSSWAIYIDGQLDTSGTAACSQSGSATYAPYFAGHPAWDCGANSSCVDGQMDEFGVWDRALTASEVYDLFQGACAY